MLKDLIKVSLLQKGQNDKIKNIVSVFWQHILFSDESRFSLRFSDGRCRVYHRSGERFTDQCVYTVRLEFLLTQEGHGGNAPSEMLDKHNARAILH
jgi:hypothetical protein